MDVQKIHPINPDVEIGKKQANTETQALEGRLFKFGFSARGTM